MYECLGHDYATGIGALQAGTGSGVERERGDGEVMPPAVELDDSEPVDWWDYHPAERKFVRVHERPRIPLFGEPEREKDAWEDEGGPGADVTLSGRRVSVMHFLDGDFELNDTENYDTVGFANPFVEEATGRGRPWTGLTLFWAEGVEPQQESLVKATYQPRKRTDVVVALEGSVDRDNIPDCLLTTTGLEQGMFIAAQRACQELGLIYLAVECRDGDLPIQSTLNKSKTVAPELWIKGPKGPAIERQSLNYERTIAGLLCRRVYDSVDGELQLRPAVPSGAAQRVEVPGIGERELSLRDRLMLEYHNGKLGGHLGRDKTFHRLERDWWWPGMYSSVVDWCRHCIPCQKENSRTGVTAWSRTEFYDRPFRVLQFDIVLCSEYGGEGGNMTGAKYILTVICCFSRWPWLIAIPDKSAEVVARALLERVIIGLAMFPTVLRSDNAKEFVSDLMRYMNRLLGINHVTGSIYHPQSQGIVENMHRTMSHILRMLIEKNPTEWEAMLPYCECILRTTPLESLGGRSSYQVVTGLIPRLPRIMSCSSGVVFSIGSSEYVDKLMKYLKETYDSVKECQKSMKDKKDIAAQEEGTLGMELQVGDAVMLKLDPTVRRAGASRFQPRARDGLWQISAKISPQTFKLTQYEDSSIPHEGTVSAENLIRVLLPLVDLDPMQPRLLEIYRNTTGLWDRYRIEKFACDGKVFLRKLIHDEANNRWNAEVPAYWRDLSETLYRWVA